MTYNSLMFKSDLPRKRTRRQRITAPMTKPQFHSWSSRTRAMPRNMKMMQSHVVLWCSKTNISTQQHFAFITIHRMLSV